MKHPCETCKRVECNGKFCGAWQDWFSEKWRGIRIMCGKEKPNHKGGIKRDERSERR